MVSKEIHAKQALLSGIKKKKQVKKAENLQRHSVSKNFKKKLIKFVKAQQETNLTYMYRLKSFSRV